MDSDPVVSVVLPTFRRPDSLTRTLTSLSAQVDPPVFEVVVVDNDEAPGVEAVVQAQSVTAPVRYLRSPVRGASHARNTGITASRGQIIAFCDDDVVPGPDWLRLLVEPVISGEFDAAAGQVRLDWSEPRPFWLAPALDGYLAAYAPYDDSRELDTADFFLTANCCFVADRLRRIGPFDPTLGPRDGVPMVNDDIDLARRLHRDGGRACYVPAAVVVHELPESRLRMRYLLRRIYAQGRSDFRLDRSELVDRRDRGLVGSLRGLLTQLGIRFREGLWRPMVAFRVLGDVARFAGFAREAAASARRSGSTTA